jgi:hypothetical protein
MVLSRETEGEHVAVDDDRCTKAIFYASPSSFAAQNTKRNAKSSR